jgi:plastocyanin
MRYRCAQAVVLLVFVPAILAGCGTDPGGPPSPAAPPASPVPHATDGASSPTARTTAAAPETDATKVVIDNFAFSPRTLTVAAGTRVTWLNRDDVPHTATSTSKPRAFNSGNLDTDERFSHVFTTPGTCEYFCVLHPKMTGQIVVK